MNRKSSSLTACVIPVLVLALGTAALARGQVRFNGSVHDYTSSSVKGGPWEFHGNWILDVLGASGKADFSIDMTMSDFGTPANPATPGQNPHVHHVVMKGATVLWNMDGCPANPPTTPANTFGFQFTGPVSLITGNGQPAPFDTVPPQSPLTVCITGVTGEAGSLAFSNITLEFGAPANTHFGVGTVIHGVVTNPQSLLGDWRGDHR
jgi:hypothetical protein